MILDLRGYGLWLKTGHKAGIDSDVEWVLRPGDQGPVSRSVVCHFNHDAVGVYAQIEGVCWIEVDFIFLWAHCRSLLYLSEVEGVPDGVGGVRATEVVVLGACRSAWIIICDVVARGATFVCARYEAWIPVDDWVFVCP